jgi:type III secretion protein Q
MALPFDLPSCSRGHAALGDAARTAGAAAARASALALGALLGLEVRVEGRARPAAPASGAGVTTVHLELAALPGAAHLEVETTLVARAVELLAGADATLAGAGGLEPLEQSALELMILAAIDGAAGAPGIAERLAPRLVRSTAPPPSPLAIDLEVRAGGVRGRARLLLPPAAVAALDEPARLEAPLAGFRLLASLRAGGAPLLPSDLSALAPGDVVRLDEPVGGLHRLVVPGGFTALGQLADDVLTVEETTVENRLSQVPVLLEVELARVPLTLADVARLAPGATLPLQLDRRGLVTLRLGERPLARGELVELDGSVGVHILSMELAP